MFRQTAPCDGHNRINRELVYYIRLDGETMIIDVHTHIFPDLIAEKAAENIGIFYELPMENDGRLQTMLEAEREAGVDRIVVCSAATTASQTAHINDYIAEVVAAHPGLLYGFGAMNQDTPDKGNEVRRIRGLGLKGVKIHPDIQRVAMNDPRFDDLYEALQEMDLVLMCHTGDTRYHNSNPPQLEDVLQRFPRLRVIGAHLGYWSNWSEGADRLTGYDNLWVDCSSSLYAMSPGEARRVIRAYGADRVLFGSDFPMWTAATEMERLKALKLTETEMEKILGANAAALLDIS